MTAPGVVLLDRGRLLADARPRVTAFGVLYDWSLEDLDEGVTVASGAAASLPVAWLETCTAALADVRGRSAA